MGADGNCFFRAMCDQRWGSDSAEEDHMELRKHTIAYMEANRDNFEPFIEAGSGTQSSPRHPPHRVPVLVNL